MVAHCINEHLQAESLPDRFQSAYCKHHSTETALLKIHVDIIEAPDQGSHIVLITLDPSAVFDTIDHKILLEWLFGLSEKDVPAV